MTLYTNLARSKYYEIPPDTVLPAGEQQIQTLAGQKRAVDGAQLGAYEVTRWQAAFLARQEVGGHWAQVRQLIWPSSEMGAAPSGESSWAALVNLGKTVLDQAVGDGAEPALGGGTLGQQIEAVETIMVGVDGEEEARTAAAARDVMETIRAALQARGITPDDSFDSLFDRLRQDYKTAGKEEELAASIAGITALAAELEEAYRVAGKGDVPGTAEVARQARRNKDVNR